MIGVVLIIIIWITIPHFWAKFKQFSKLGGSRMIKLRQKVLQSSRKITIIGCSIEITKVWIWVGVRKNWLQMQRSVDLSYTRKAINRFELLPLRKPLNQNSSLQRMETWKVYVSKIWELNLGLCKKVAVQIGAIQTENLWNQPKIHQFLRQIYMAIFIWFLKMRRKDNRKMFKMTNSSTIDPNQCFLRSILIETQLWVNITKSNHIHKLVKTR